MLDKLKNLKIEWPTVAALGLVLASIVAVYGLSSGEERSELLAGVAAAGSVVLALLRAMAAAKSGDES